MRRKKSNMSKRAIVLLLSLVLVVSTVIGTTMTYRVSSPDPVVNTFTPARVDSKVVEDITTNVKKNVSIQNTGDADAYIRAAVVVTWRNGNNVLPAASDSYNISYNISETKADWIAGSDGFYYYTKPGPAQDYTGELFTDCKPKEGKAPAEGYELCVEILSEAIQAEPADAVRGAWGVIVNADGTISKSSK